MESGLRGAKEKQRTESMRNDIEINSFTTCVYRVNCILLNGLASAFPRMPCSVCMVDVRWSWVTSRCSGSECMEGVRRKTQGGTSELSSSVQVCEYTRYSLHVGVGVGVGVCMCVCMGMCMCVCVYSSVHL